jgi:hypothetical protein
VPTTAAHGISKSHGRNDRGKLHPWPIDSSAPLRAPWTSSSPANFSSVEKSLADIDRRLQLLRATFPSSAPTVPTLDRLRHDLAAARFHLRPPDKHAPTLLAILGGTGTGKSTLANRLLGADVSATSFRRTYTAGAIAVAHAADAIPAGWLGVDVTPLSAQQLPARGTPESLAVVPFVHELTRRVTIVDTPDLDGDQPAHHAQADRAFRWANAVLFLVTPEKYQMTELVPYYRLASRYGLPALFVMNKAEERAVVEDFASQRGSRVEGQGASKDGPDAPHVFAIPRDDARYEPPAEMNLDALRGAIASLRPAEAEQRTRGISNRVGDLTGRLRDQLIAPLRAERREAERVVASLRAMESPAASVDVNPLTRALQRRLQQRSVLYLMGPGRVLDRVRQVPGLLARLPRTTWDLLRHGQTTGGNDAPEFPKDNWDRGVPDFRAALQDQFAVVQSRIDDLLRSAAPSQRWLAQDAAGYTAARIDPAAAGAIADEELAALRQWLQKRWNAPPRDTAVIGRLLKVLPGGEKLTQWSEAAPYLLAIVVATHHAFFGPVDLMVLGGWSLATWATERMSNEVASRTRATNKRIAERFGELAHEQIKRVEGWLNRQAPPVAALDELERSADQVQEEIGRET